MKDINSILELIYKYEQKLNTSIKFCMYSDGSGDLYKNDNGMTQWLFEFDNVDKLIDTIQSKL